MDKKIKGLFLGGFWGYIADKIIMSVGKTIESGVFNIWDAFGVFLIIAMFCSFAIMTYKYFTE